MMEEDLSVILDDPVESGIPDVRLNPRTQRVLLLWPDDCAESILIMLLTSADYIIRTVRTETEAMESLNREKFLAIVFDGSAFDPHELQGLAELRHIPVIRVATTRESGHKTGLNDTCVKEILTSLFTLATPWWMRKCR